MDFSATFVLGLVSRWLHILAAITAVGGTIFIRYAFMPSLGDLPEDQRKSLHEAVRSRWAKVVMIAIGFLLLSGLYNFVMINRSLGETAEGIKPLYHSFFGVKFLLALGIFFIASALVGRSSAFDKIRANARFWATLNIALAVLLVCISGFLRLTRDGATARGENPPPVDVSPIKGQGR